MSSNEIVGALTDDVVDESEVVEGNGDDPEPVKTNWNALEYFF
jgi:hypothetical protein